MILKLKKQQNGIYKMIDSDVEITVSRYEGKWIADIWVDGYQETSMQAKTKKEAIERINEYYGV